MKLQVDIDFEALIKDLPISNPFTYERSDIYDIHFTSVKDRYERNVKEA